MPASGRGLRSPGIWSGCATILRRILYKFRHWFESDAKAVGVKAADKDTDHA
ncbi:MAG: hypothetical protein ACLSHC_01985 [Bilophila wadsworthia]